MSDLTLAVNRLSPEVPLTTEIHITTSFQFERTYRGLDPQLIGQQAKLLRPGHECTLHFPSDWTLLQAHTEMYSGFNIHILLDFDDGVRWVVRVRQAHIDRPPKVIGDMVTKSEVITLRVLKKGGVRVPDAWLPPPLVTQGIEEETPQQDQGEHTCWSDIRIYS